MTGRLGKWWAGKKSLATTEGRQASFAVESLEPRLLLSAVLGSEQVDPILVDVNPTASIVPVAAIEVSADTSDGATDAQLDSLQLSLTRNAIDETQADNGGSDSTTVDSQPAESGIETDPLLSTDLSGATSSQDSGSLAASYCDLAYAAESTSSFVNDGVCDLQAPAAYESSSLPSSTEQLVDTLRVPNPPPQDANYLTVTASGMIDVWDFQPQLLAESGVSGLIIQGTDETDDRLVVDLNRGDLPLPVTFHGGAGGYDTLVITGMAVGSYTPGQVFGDGLIQAGASTISFTGLEPIFIDGATVTGTVPAGLDTSGLRSTLTFTTPAGADDITIDSPAAGQNRISGTSGGAAFESITFTNIQAVVIDIGTNDGLLLVADTVTIASELVATGLGSLTIRTGSGDDTLVVQTDHLSLPVADRTFSFDGGTGSDTIRGPAAGMTWDLSGSGAGTLGGTSGLAFTGVEQLIGAEGQDNFVFASGVSFGGTIDGGSGAVNTLDYSAYTTGVTVDLASGTATGTTGITNIQSVIGGTEADSLTGDVNANWLSGGRGDDTLAGGAGNDSYILTVDGGAETIIELVGGGSDTLFGADMASTWVLSGANAGSLNGQSFSEIENLVGGAADDEFVVEAGGSLTGAIQGGGGTDILNYSMRTTSVTVDLLAGTATDTGGVGGIENVVGGSGDDTLTGDANGNALTGRTGDDTLTGGAGDDILVGGLGNDTYVFDADGPLGTDTITELSCGGTDTLDFSPTTASVTIKLANASQQVGSNLLIVFSADNVIENVIGGSGADTITGNSWDNVLAGGPGNDTLAGAGGDDTYVLTPGGGTETITEAAGGGSDTLDYSAFTTPVTVNLSTGAAPGTSGIANIENVIGGSGADSLTGDGNANRLTGGPGNDTLAGGGGDDTYVLTPGGGTETITEAVGGGSDTLDYSAYAIDITVKLGGSGPGVFGKISNIENITGGSGNDTLTGDANANRLAGGGGTDVLTGGKGDDTYVLTPGGTVTISEPATGGADTLDYSSYTEGVTVNLAAGTATGVSNNIATIIENAIGGSGDDILTGDSRANRLRGGPGNDTLTGGTGNDIYVIINGGADTIVEGAGGGIDTIVGPDSDTGWSITGANSGTVAGTSFVNVENLVGGSGDDTFTFASGGSISGTIDGSLGSDSFAVANKAGGYTVFNPASTPSGTVTFAAAISDVGTVRYAGMEDQSPVTGDASVVIKGSAYDDLITLEDADPLSTGQMKVTFGNVSFTTDGSIAANSFTFYNPSSSLVIKGRWGEDTIIVASADPDFSADLEIYGRTSITGLDLIDYLIDAFIDNLQDLLGDRDTDTVRFTGSISTHGGDIGVAADAITIGTDAVLSTSKAGGKSGDIDLGALTITLEDGSGLLADAALEPESTPGDVMLIARAVSIVRLDLDAGPAATITATGAQIKGDAVTLKAWAAEPFGVFGFKKDASAAITITDTTIVGGVVRLSAFADTTLLPPQEVQMSGNPALTFAHDPEGDGTNDTITRDSGSWLADGFLPGMSITVDGSTIEDDPLTIEDESVSNDGAYWVKWVSLDGRTLTLASGEEVADQGPISGLTVIGSSILPDVEDIIDVLGFSLNSKLVALSNATAKVQIKGSSTIISAGNVQIDAEADSRATPIYPGLSIPVVANLTAAYAESRATAEASVQGTTTITAGGNFSLSSSANNTVTVTALVTGRNKLISLGFAGAQTWADSLAYTGAGTTITAGNVAVSAESSNDIAVAATAYNRGGSGATMTFALNLLDSDTVAYISGHVIAAGDVTVTAAGDMVNNITEAASANLGSTGDLFTKLENFQNQFIQELAAPFITGLLSGPAAWFGTKVVGFLFPVVKSGSFNLSGAVSYTDAENTVDAYLADGADVEAQGDLEITGSLVDRTNSSASNEASSDKVGVGGAVVYGDYDNHVRAFIGAADVDAVGALDVEAHLTVPFPWEIEFANPQDVINNLGQGLFNMIFTTYTMNKAAGSKFGLAATAIVQFRDNTSEAFIGGGAHVNTAFQNPGERVSVSARTEVNSMNLNYTSVSKSFLQKLITNQVAGNSYVQRINGIIRAAGFSDKLTITPVHDVSAGIGGAVNYFDYNDTAIAYIDETAEVRSAGDIDVLADTEERIISLAVAMGTCDKLGVFGSAGVVMLDSTSLAYIEDTATVMAGDDLTVRATGDPRVYNLTGGIVKGAQVGIGASVALSDVTAITKAFIGNATVLTGNPKLTFSDTALTGNPELTFHHLSVSGVSLTFADEDDTADTITRGDGVDWAADGFAVDQYITVEGSTLNDGVYRIAAIEGTTLTLADGDELGGNDTDDTDETTSGATVRAADTITRSSGSWIDDGFLPGQTITVSGSTSNNGSYLITEVTDTVLMLAPLALLVDETTSGVSVTGPDYISRAKGSWLADGFQPGQTITITGASANDGTYEVASVNNELLTLAEDESLTDATGVSNVSITDDPSPATGTITVTDDININAFSGPRIFSFSLAGAISTGKDNADPQGASGAGSATTTPSGQSSGSSFGIGASADASLAFVNPYPLAYIDAAVTVHSQDLSVVAQASATPMLLGAPSLTFADSGTSDTITRDSGNWLAEGFRVGQSIKVHGTESNDGLYRIAALTNTVLTLRAADALTGETTDEASIKAGAAMTDGTELTFEAALLSQDAITRSSGSWMAEGFRPGQTITVTGTSGNNGTYKIAEVTHSTLTLGSFDSVFDGLKDETTNTAVIVSEDDGKAMQIYAFAGAVTVSKKQSSGALSGSFTMNTIKGATSAYLGQATVTLTGGLVLGASTPAEILSIGASVTASKAKLGVAGQVTYNVVGIDTQAYVSEGADVTVAGAATLDALDLTEIVSIAGAVNVQYNGKAGIGLSVAINLVDNDTRAFIDNSDLDATGAVSLDAAGVTKIQAIAVGVSVGVSTGSSGGEPGSGGGSDTSITGAGAASVNEITNEVEAYISGAATEVTTGSDLSVAASDEGTKIVADAWTASVAVTISSQSSATSVALGGEVAVNTIANTVRAYVDDAAIIATGDIEVSADSGAKIDTRSAGVAVSVASGTSSVSVAIGMAVSANEIDATTEAYLYDADVISSAGQITLAAGSDAEIRSAVAAASLAISIGTQSAVSVSGAGALAMNNICGKTNAYIIGGGTDSFGNLALGATNESTIEALVIALSGGAASIGAAVAFNTIDGEEQGDRAAFQVLAYAQDAALTVGGNLSLMATSEATISAKVGAGSVGVVAGFGTSLAASGAGVFTSNDISMDVMAFIDGLDRTTDSDALGGSVELRNGSLYSLTLQARDASSITAEAGAASVSLAVSGSNLSLSIGLALAHNRIDNRVEAFLDNLDTVITNGGDVVISAQDQPTIAATAAAAAVSVAIGTTGIALSGGGAEATNVILTTTDAYISDSIVGTSAQKVGDVDLDAKSTADIDATIVAVAASVSYGGSTGVGVALGVAVARNFIGWDPTGNSVTADYSSHDTPAQLLTGEKVEIASGPMEGEVFEYLGPTLTDGDPNTDGNQPIDLSIQNYQDPDIWEQVSVSPSPAQVQAYIIDSSIDSAGVLTLDAVDQASIDAIVIAGAVALSGGGTTGVGVSGAGVYTENKIKTDVKAYIDGSANTAPDGIEVLSVWLYAEDSSSINAVAGAASLAAALGSTAGVAVAVGLSVAFNEVSNDVAAYISGMDEGVTAFTGSITISALSQGEHLFNIALTDPDLPSKLDDAATADADNPDNPASETDDVTSRFDDAVNEAVQDADEDRAVLETLRGAFTTAGETLALYDTVATAAKYRSRDGSQDVREGDTVLLAKDYAGGGLGGRVYRYIVKAPEDSDTPVGQTYPTPNTINLGTQNYADTTKWQLVDKLKLSILVEGKSWLLMAPDGKAYVLELNEATNEIGVSRETINAVSAAAALAVGIGTTGVAVSGAGAVAQNVILTKTNAYSLESVLHSAGAVMLDAESKSKISSVVVAASLALGGGGAAGIGASIGVSVARNFIGWSPDGTETPAQVQAYLKNTSVTAVGDLKLTSRAAQTIDSIVIAGSVAIGLGGTAGVAVSGSGVWAENKIGVDVKSYIDGDGDGGIVAGSVTLTADDTSTIIATAGAASVAASVGGAAGVSVSIGVSLARNTITSNVEAYILNAGVDAGAGGVTISAGEGAAIHAVCFAASLAAGFGGAAGIAISGAGADANNIILTDTNAYIQGSTVYSDGKVDLDAENAGIINATVVSASAAISVGGFAGVGASIGVAVARNYIGWNPDYAETADYETGDNPDSIVTGNTVKIAAGPNAGNVYEYIGTETLNRPNGPAPDDETDEEQETRQQEEANWLTRLNYADNSQWRLINLDPDAAQVQAYILDSNVDAAGALTLDALSRQTISATVFAGSVAISGGLVGVALSGAGASSENRIATLVQAYLRGNKDSKGIEAESISLNAEDNSDIDSFTGAVSVAASGGLVGVSLSIGVGIAFNEIDNDVAGFIKDVDAGVTSTGATGDISLTVSEDADIEATAAAASAAVALGLVGASLSGAGAVANNVILGSTNAYVDNSVLASAQDVILDADNTSTINAEVLAVAAALAGGAFAGAGLSIGAAVARNSIGYSATGVYSPIEVQAYIKNSSLDATRDLTLTATSTLDIDAIIWAGSVAASAGGFAGIGAGGAGASAVNRVAANVKAYIDGSGTTGIVADSISLTAGDTSIIDATVGTAAVAIGVGLVGAGISISVGVSIASNEVDNQVSAYIANAQNVQTRDGGAITISATENATINALGVAASAAVGVGLAGISFAGAGVDVTNVILNKTNAYIENAVVGTESAKVGDVTITATDTSEIDAEVGGLSIAAAGGFVAVGVAVGVAMAENLIGYTPDGTADPAEVRAYVKNSSLDALGDLILEAVADQTIIATIAAAAIAVGGGAVAITGAGAGASTRNRVRTLIKAFIDGAGTTDIVADSISLTANDTSTITAFTGSASLAGAVGAIAGSISVAVGVAKNEIANEVDACVLDADLTATGTRYVVDEATYYAIDIRAIDEAMIDSTATAASAAADASWLGGISIAGGGADAFNVIQTKTRAYADSSDLMAGYIDATGEVPAGNISIEATDNSTITALVTTEVLAAGVSGGISGAIAIGTATAHNFIGWGTDTTDTNYDLTTADEPDSISKGTKIRIASGYDTGAIYEYIADEPLDHPHDDHDHDIENWLTTLNYADANLWRQTNLAPTPAEVKAYLNNSDADAAGKVTLAATETATINAEIRASVFSVSGGTIAVALSGAGISIENKINTEVMAYIQGTETNEVTIEAGDDVTVTASDSSTIGAKANAVSFATAIGAGGAGAISLSYAYNTISNDVEAYAKYVSIETTSDTADLVITGSETAEVTSTAAASASAFGVFFSAGIAGATSEATVETTTRAYADLVELVIGGNVDIDAIMMGQADTTTTGATYTVAFTSEGEVETDATATVNPFVESYLTGNADGVTAGGDISVGATLGASATALAEGSSTSISLGSAHAAPKATAKIAPQPEGETVTTVSSSIRGGHVVSETGDINVKAIYNQDLSLEDTFEVFGTGAEATAHASSGSFDAKGGANATATETPCLESWVAGDGWVGDGTTLSPGATLSAGDAVTVISSSLTTPVATAAGKAGGFVGIGESHATATGSPIVKARMDGTIGSEAGPGAVDLEVRALGVDKAKATAQAVSKGFAAENNPSDNEAKSIVSPTLDAHIGENNSEIYEVSEVYVSGTITVEAKENPEADASSKGVAKGAGGVGGSKSTVNVTPDVTAYIGSESLIEAGSVNVSAIAKPTIPPNQPDYQIESVDAANDTLTVNNHNLESGVVIEYHTDGTAIGGLKTTYTDAEGETSARQYSVIYVDGNTIALGAGFTLEGITGNLIEGGGSTVTSFQVDDDGDGLDTSYAAGATAAIDGVGSISIDSAGAYVFVPIFGYSGTVPEITYTLSTGEMPTLTIIAEAADCGVNALNETITFATPHNFVDGDQVVYHASDPSKAIGGLTDGETYTVRVIDANSIQLVAPGFSPDDMNEFTVSDVTSNTINDTNTFTNGQAVTYVAPPALTFASVQVDVDVDWDKDTITDNPDANNIVFMDGTVRSDGSTDIFGVDHHFHEGNYVVYRVSSLSGNPVPIGGLKDGYTYRIQYASEHSVRLAPTVSGTITFFTQATSDNGQAYMTGVNWADYGFAAGQHIHINGDGDNNGGYTISSIDGNRLYITGNFDTAGEISGKTVDGQDEIALNPNKTDSSVHSLVLASNAAIGGLVSGQTYYIVNRPEDGSSYQLASTPGGAAITLDKTGLSDSAKHWVGTQSIDLQAPVAADAGTTHEFRINITGSLPDGKHWITGEGGVNLAELVAPAGDTVSTADSQGSGGGVYGGSTNKSNSNADFTVVAYIASGSLTATGDISVLAKSQTNARANTTNACGGFVGVGKSYATTDQTSTTYAYIAAGANIVSGGDVTIDAWSNHIATGTATAKAGGFAADVRAYMTSELAYDTQAFLDDGAKIAAAGYVGITSDANTDTLTHSYADGRGFGGGGYAETDMDILDGSQSLAKLDPDSVVIAGTVALRATTSNMDIYADAKGYGAGFVGVSDDFADIDINADNKVLLGSGSSLTGYRGVDLEATFNNVDTYAYSYGRVTGVFGWVDSDGNNTTTLTSSVVADPREDATHARAQVTAGPRVNDGTTSEMVDALTPGMQVAFATGPLAGDVYEYIGVLQTDSNPNVTGNQKFDLSLQPYEDADLWKQVEVMSSEDSEGHGTMVNALTPGMVVRISSGDLTGNLYEYIGGKLTDSDPGTDGNQQFNLSLQNYSDPGLWKLVTMLDDHHLATNVIGDATNPNTLDQLALYVHTTNYNISIDADASVKKKALAAGHADTDIDNNQTRTIDWNADVRISSGEGAELVIDASGNIVKAVGVTVKTAADPEQDSGKIAATEAEIFVNDIGNGGSGQVYFNDAWVDGDTVEISGAGSTWDFSDTLGQVLITNSWNKTLKINNINVVNTTGNPLVDLNSKYVTLEFALDRTAAPTLVQILNEANSDIILNGTINNPIGSTVIHNTGGDITAARARDAAEIGTGRISLIRTAILDISAPAGGIGSASPRVNVDMIYTDELPSVSFRANGVCGAADALFLDSNSFFTGQLVQYTTTGTPIAGLVNGNYYTVIRSDDGTIQLATPGGDVITLDPSASDAATVHRLTAAQHVVGVAGGDIYLDLKAVLRDETPVTEFTATIDSLTAGGSIDLLLQDAEQETGAGAGAGVRVTTIPADGGDAHFVNYFRPDSGSASQDLGAFGGDTFTPVDCIYDFRDLDRATGDRTVAGLTAGTGNIIIKDVQGATTGEGLALPTVAVLGLTDLLGTGHIDVNVDGAVELTEVTGDLRVGLIRSRGSDVTLTASDASIVDALNDAASDVTGVNITLTALQGGIGTFANRLEFNWSNRTLGSHLLQATVAGATYTFRYAGTTGAILDAGVVHLRYIGSP